MSNVFNKLKENIVPLAIIFAAAYLTGGVGLGFYIGSGALLQAGLAVGLAAVSLALADDPEGQQGIDYGSAISTIRAERIPAQYPIGRVRKSGQVVYAAVDDDDTLHLALCLGEGSCDGIERVFVRSQDEFEFVRDSDDNRRLIPAEGSPYKFTAKERRSRTETRTEYQGRDSEPRQVTYTEYYDVDVEANALEIYEYFRGDGTEGQELRDAVRNIDGALPWTTSHRMDGKSWVYIKAKQPPYDRTADDAIEQRFWQSFPDLSFLMRGLKLTWPGQTTPAWTENTAAIYYWWLTQRRGLTPSSINLAAFNAAYALCNQTLVLTGADGHNLSYPTTIPRYTSGGTITANSSVRSVEDQLNLCMAGNITSFGGQIYIQPGADRLPTGTITEDMVIEPPTIQLQTNESRRFNSLITQMEQSDLHDYRSHSTPYIDDEQVQARDDGRKIRTLRTNLINKATSATNIMGIILRERRASLTVQLTCMSGSNFELLSLVPGDKVLLQVPDIAPLNTPFKYISGTLNANNSMNIVLREFPDGIYEDTIILPDLTPREFTLPNQPRDPEGINADISTFVNTQGQTKFALDMSWRATTSDTVIYVRRVGGGYVSPRLRTGESQYRLELDDSGVYQIDLIHIDSFGRASSVASTTATAFAQLIPVPTPTLVSSEVRRGNLRSIFAGVENRDVSGVEIRATFAAGSTLQPQLNTLDEDNWDDALRLTAETTLPSVRGNNIENTAAFSSSGWYHTYARFVNHFDTLGPIVDLGIHLVTLPDVNAESFHSHPQWAGISNNFYPWRHINTTPLLPDQPNARTVTGTQWSATQDTPLGPAPNGWYETISRDLGEVKSVNLSCSAIIGPTPGGRTNTRTPEYTIYHRQATNQSWVSVPFTTAPITANARYIKARVTLNRGSVGFDNTLVNDFILTSEDRT